VEEKKKKGKDSDINPKTNKQKGANHFASVKTKANTTWKLIHVPPYQRKKKQLRASPSFSKKETANIPFTK